MKHTLPIVAAMLSCALGVGGAWFFLKDRMKAEVIERVRFEVRVERLELKTEQNRVDIWELKSK